MERNPFARLPNHEAFFGPWRPMSEAERGKVNPNHIVNSGTEIKVPMVPTRLYPPTPNLKTGRS